ncbi:MAG: cation:proton antiporter, partial [Fimbriimonadaceae bacterium]
LAVLSVCKIVGLIGTKYFGQSQVTMEMVAGVILGPSVFGALAPQVQTSLFPKTLALASGEVIKHPSMAILYIVAQTGLVLYMFVVGLEFDPTHLKSRAKSAISISSAGIIFPFALACIAFFAMPQIATLFTEKSKPFEEVIFLGAAMCITAFPMLARIIYELKLSKTAVGTIALSSGAVDDLVAWLLLAFVLSVFNQSQSGFIIALGGTAFFIAFLLIAGKRLFKIIAPKEGEDLTQNNLTLILLVLFAGAWFTDTIGIFAVFGAFAIGASFPKNKGTKQLQEKIEPITVGLFLPFFFTFSGLNTEIGTLNNSSLIVVTLVLLAIAILGKLGGCYLAARLNNIAHPDALKIGILMNARGLMELIILNVGLEKGIISKELFTMMVIMAIVTTLMATPIFKAVLKKYPLDHTEAAAT